jgi:pyruvate dehydrogenase E2 component (dihydrolipoamide acetyltransferase)
MVDIKIPKIGVEDGEVIVASWEKDEGDFIEKNETIAVVETEKVNTDILAPASGILQIKLREGETAKMTETIGYIVTESTVTSKESEQPPVKTEKKLEKQAEGVNRTSVHLSPAKRRQQLRINATHVAEPQPTRIIGSPAAKRVARELGVKLELVSGTGPKGAILASDVYEASKKVPLPLVEQKSAAANHLQEDNVASRQKLTPIRKTIARNMYESLQQTAQMTLMGTISIDKLWPFFQQMKEDLQTVSLKPSWAAIFIKILALALEEHPQLNGTFQNEELVIWKDINIGVAISTEKGLVVPCIKHANAKSLLKIHQELKELSEKARNNRLTAEDLVGSTFTLTNVGSFGGEFGTPILNRNELGILGVGGVTKMPVVNDKDEIVVGRCCPYSLTVDHQIVDGETAGLFIQTVKRLVQSPSLVLMS